MVVLDVGAGVASSFDRQLACRGQVRFLVNTIMIIIIDIIIITNDSNNKVVVNTIMHMNINLIIVLTGIMKRSPVTSLQNTAPNHIWKYDDTPGPPTKSFPIKSP